MDSFVFSIPTKIIFGSGSLAQTGAEAARLGKKPLLLTGMGSARRHGTLGKVLGLLKAAGAEPVLFEKIEPNPRCETVDNAVKLAVAGECDSVIGLGGGSVMDAAKAAAAALGEARKMGKNPVSVFEYSNGMLDKIRPVTGCLPLMLISTAAASGSEGDDAAVLTRWATREKVLISHPGLFPAVSIVDPVLCLTLPLEQTREGAVDIMVHALEENFSGNDKASVQDRMAEGLVSGVMQNLELLEADPRNLVARENLSWASVAALLAGGPSLGRIGGFLMHDLEHPVSGHFDIPHARGLAALWIPFLKFAAPRRGEKITAFGEHCLDVDKGSPMEATLEALAAWLAKHKMNCRLADFGVKEEHLETLAEDAVRIYGGRNRILGAALGITKEKAILIYRSAL